MNDETPVSIWRGGTILAGLAAHDLAGDAVLDMRFRDRVVVRYPEDDAHRLDPASGEGQS